MSNISINAGNTSEKRVSMDFVDGMEQYRTSASFVNISGFGNASDIWISLDYVEYQLFLKDLPAFIYLTFLFVIGSIGNMHTLVIYYRQFSPSNHRLIVLTLSFVDLIGCAIAVPYDIIDMRYYLTIPSDFNCRFFIFLDFFTGIGSVALLAHIAVERFRKVCKPHGRQLTIQETKCLCGLILVVSIGISSPCLVLYTQAFEETEFPGVFRTMCVDAKNSEKMIHFRAYNTFLLCISSILLMICIVSYLFLSSKLRHHRRRLSNPYVSYTQAYTKKRPEVERANRLDSNIQNGADLESEQTTLQYSDSEAPNDSDDKTVVTEVNITSKHSIKREKHLQRSERITFVFLVTTFLSYGCFLTTVVTEFLWSWGHSFASDLGAVFAFILRVQFINNAVNPIVYYILDNRFRTEVELLYKNLYKKIFTREPIRKQSLISIGSNFQTS